jgi:simple sugar transport system ATP-binding protein
VAEPGSSARATPLASSRQVPGQSALCAESVSKRFGETLANDQVSFDARWGEIQAVLGENGAGKTTLMNMLSGLYQPDSGRLLLDGRATVIGSPRRAAALGIGMVHQHFMLVPTCTVLENVILGTHTTGHLLVRRGLAAPKVQALARKLGLELSGNELVSELSVGAQQKVEIMKLMFRGARILLLDEPTAVLAPQESNELYRMLRGLAQEGNSVVLVTHKLREALSVADSVTVLRGGRLVASQPAAELTEEALGRLMVDFTPRQKLARTKPASPVPLLELNDVGVKGRGTRWAVSSATFTVDAGEIVGVAGIEGNGQTELADAISGLRRIDRGQIRVCGVEARSHDPAQRIGLRMAVIPEDRHRFGLISKMTAAENAVLPVHHKPPVARWAYMRKKVMHDVTSALMNSFDVRPPDPAKEAGTFSGGNQQKLVLGRELTRRPRVIVACQPTRGLDLKAINYVHERLVQARDEGAAVLLLSQDLDEILDLSDRILVMFRGEVVAALDRNEATVDRLGRLMLSGVA